MKDSLEGTGNFCKQQIFFLRVAHLPKGIIKRLEQFSEVEYHPRTAARGLPY
jgi:hypothetical protein